MGHDRLMLALDRRKADLRAILHSLSRRYPTHTPQLAMSEFAAIHGDRRGWPYWRATISNAEYMASMWSYALNDGLPWATGGDLLGVGEGSVIGAAPYYTLSAEALVRKTLLPMFAAGGKTVSATVANNDDYNTRLGTRRDPLKYQALQVSASHDHHGDVWVLVINRLPDTPVATTIKIAGYQAKATVARTETSAAKFGFWNRDGEAPRVIFQPTTTETLRIHHRLSGSAVPIIVDSNSVTVYHFSRQR